MKLLSLLFITLFLSACAMDIAGILKTEPGLQKCVSVSMDEGSVQAGPVSFVGKGVVYHSVKDEWCAKSLLNYSNHGHMSVE